MTGVLVVDDSRFMRTVVAGILTDHGYEVGTASDGQAAVDLVKAADPDVVTMDVDMPGMNGVEATGKIMTEHPTPVVMVSAHTETGSKTTLQALARGAVDFVKKPGTDDEMDVAALADDLIGKVETASNATVSAIDPRALPGSRSAGNDPDPGTADVSTGDASRDRPWAGADPAEGDGDPTPSIDPIEGDPVVDRTGRSTVVIGASTGGPHVVERILSVLPADLGARVLVVQHMPDSFTDRFAVRLDGVSAYDVREATDGSTVSAGEAVVAKGDYHLRAVGDGVGGVGIRLTKDERVHSVRPAVDVTMQSVAETVATPLVGVVLTGMGSDGAAGIEAISAAGGTTIAQAVDSCPVPGMPGQAIATGCVDRELPVESIPEAICEAVTRERRREEAHA